MDTTSPFAPLQVICIRQWSYEQCERHCSEALYYAKHIVPQHACAPHTKTDSVNVEISESVKTVSLEAIHMYAYCNSKGWINNTSLNITEQLKQFHRPTETVCLHAITSLLWRVSVRKLGKHREWDTKHSTHTELHRLQIKVQMMHTHCCQMRRHVDMYRG